MTTLVWFRDDLRTDDHPALAAAASDPGGVVALYVLDEVSAGVRPLGGATKWWLHHSLESLAASLKELGVPLVLQRGAAGEVVPAVACQLSASRVLWNRRYGAAERRIDAELKRNLRERGFEAHSFAGSLLFEPWTITTKTGDPYRVYSPFWRACLASPPPRAPIAVPVFADPPVAAAATMAAVPSDALADWQLLPMHPDWAAEFCEHWQPGEAAASARLSEFLTERAHRYASERDLPASDATSGLAPHLRFGEISPQRVWHESLASGADVGMFLSELGWREFAWHTYFHRPDLSTQNLDRRFDAFPWREDAGESLARWQQGRTGIPLVDAGMRELWRSGTMHNRVRMVVASFLVKNLLVDWREGEAWFWDTLVDADAASNPFNWQWVAGCGADAAPYFRIFNPVTQQQKFDADGVYVDRWAPDSVLTPPMVDLKATRVRALAAFDRVKSQALGGDPRRT